MFRLKTRTPKNADKAKYAHAHMNSSYTNTNRAVALLCLLLLLTAHCSLMNMHAATQRRCLLC